MASWDEILEHAVRPESRRTSFAYDGLGRRITEEPWAANLQELYYTTGWQLIEQRVGAAGLTMSSQVVYSPVYTDAIVLRDFDLKGVPTFSVAHRAYALQDANFNVTALVTRFTLIGDGGIQNGIVDIVDQAIVANHWQQAQTNATWTVTQRIAYDAYGTYKVLVRDDQGAWHDDWGDYLAWEHFHQGLRIDKYAGQWEEVEEDVWVWVEGTGWYENRNRIYSATMARFGQQDPLGYVDGMNTYLMEHADPVSGLDPWGLFDLWAAVDTAIGFAAMPVLLSFGQEYARDLGGTLRHLPQGYWESLKSGEQADSLQGTGEGLLNHVTGGRVGYATPEFGYCESYNNGLVIGQVWGYANDRILRRSGTGRATPPATNVTGKVPSPRGTPAPAKPTGRGANKLQPDPAAQGPHSTLRRDPHTGEVTHYETWRPQSNPQNPSPWESVKRYDATGKQEYSKVTQQYVPTPHVHDPTTAGGIRPVQPGEMPR